MPFKFLLFVFLYRKIHMTMRRRLLINTIGMMIIGWRYELSTVMPPMMTRRDVTIPNQDKKFENPINFRRNPNLVNLIFSTKS